MSPEKTDRRQFLRTSIDAVFGLSAIAAFADGSSLETMAQSERKYIGAFTDNPPEHDKFLIVDRFTDGAFFVQEVQQTDEYRGEILYFTRKGKSGEYTEWSVRCDLYKKGNPAPVNTISAEGSAESGRFVFRKTDQNNENKLESSYTDGLYFISGLPGLIAKNAEDAAKYIKYFKWTLETASPPGLLGPLSKPMPPGYNPLKQ